MAEESVTKWWAVGAKEEATVRKYISFLHKHSMFGGHVGLPENIRNEDPNRSLDSSRGIYDMVEVYSLSGTSCPTGTVVNFLLDNPVNPIGKTYVYPCNDTSKPMGYMITKAEPNIWGVCVVSGILEVPLIYLRDTSSFELERKDYVEYDLENKAFKFSDSGYPVFNVYQDVDGDWIAIILFGDVKADWEYDGSFATTITGITGSTMFVDVLGGDVFFNDVRGECADLETPIALSTGESLWLQVTISGDTHSYSYLAQSNIPIDGSTVFHTKIAENDNGKLIQKQYGDIRYTRTKLISGSTNVHIYPANGFGDVVLSVDSTGGGGAEFYTPPFAALGISGTPPDDGLGITFVHQVKAGTVGFFDDGGGAKAVWSDVYGTSIHGLTSGQLYNAPTDGWIRVSVIDGGTASGKCLSIQDVKGNMPIYKYASFNDFKYDGAFAVKVASVDSQNPTTLNVTTNAGSLVFEGRRKDINASSSHVLENGKSVWLKYNALTDVANKRYSATPYADTHDPNTFIIELAKNVNGKLKQVQFGEIVIAKDKLEATVSDNTASIALYGTTNSVNFIGGSNVSITGTTESDGDVNVVIGSTGGGGGTQDLDVTVDGGTAFIGLTGSTEAVKLIGTGFVNITGDTNNNVFIHGNTDSTFSYLLGAPNYGNVVVNNLQFNTMYGSWTTTHWIIGCINTGETNDGVGANVWINFYKEGSLTNGFLIYDCMIAQQSVPSSYGTGLISVPVFIPITAGHSVEFTQPSSGTASLNLFICSSFTV